MVWIACTAVALLVTTLRVIDYDGVGHWWSFSKPIAALGALGITTSVWIVAAVGTFTYTQLPAAREATALEEFVSAALASVIALASARQYRETTTQRVRRIGDRDYTVSVKNSRGSAELVLGFIPDIVATVDLIVQSRIEEWADRLSDSDLISAVALADIKSPSPRPSAESVRSRKDRRAAMESGDQDRIQARLECIEDVVFRFNAYRVRKK